MGAILLCFSKVPLKAYLKVMTARGEVDYGKDSMGPKDKKEKAPVGTFVFTHGNKSLRLQKVSEHIQENKYKSKDGSSYHSPFVRFPSFTFD